MFLHAYRWSESPALRIPQFRISCRRRPLKTVLKNRERLAENMRIPLSDFTIAKQVHSGTVTLVMEGMRGYGAADLDTAVEGTDAMVTDVPHLCLAVLMADCVPVLFLDPQKRVVAAVHAGWRGTVKLATQNAAETLKQEFNCNPAELLVGIGALHRSLSLRSRYRSHRTS